VNARGHGLWFGHGLAALGLWLAMAAPRADAAEPEQAEVRFFPGSGGRFEVAALEGEDGARLARLAEEAWAVWRGPLGLPDRWATGITVRLTPAEAWDFAEPAWRVSAEATGLVSVRIRGGGASGPARERRWAAAMAEAILMRLAISQGVGGAARAAPDWLVAAAAEAVLIEVRPALGDAWRQAAARPGGAAGLEAILKWRGAQTSEGGEPSWVGAFGVWRWLGAGPGRADAWPRFIAALLAGEGPGLALTRAYGPGLARPEKIELELAWRTALAAASREQATPLFGAEESRRHLERLARVVLTPTAGGAEAALELGALTAAEARGFPAAEREERARWLTASFARMHPFYRNAAGSLGRCWQAQERGDDAARDGAVQEWRADFAAGIELQRGSAAALDAP
jgi:hypothetical protein